MQFIPDNIEKKLLSTVYLLSVAVLEKFTGDLKLELVGDTVQFDLVPDVTGASNRGASLSTEAEIQILLALENELVEELQRTRHKLQELRNASKTPDALSDAVHNGVAYSTLNNGSKLSMINKDNKKAIGTRAS